MAGTTMAAFKAALKYNLEERQSLASVQVAYGDPGDAARRQRIWLGHIESGTHETPAMREGRRRRHEDYILQIYIEVIGGAPEKAEERACEISQEIEECLADDITQGVDKILWAVVSEMEMITRETTDGARAVLRLGVSVKANLL